MKNKILFVLLFTLFFLSLFGQSFYPEIKSIQLHYQKINSKKDWKEIASFDLLDGDSETVLYYSKIGLEKLVQTNFGEIGKLITEYYFVNNKLSFVFEQQYHYNYQPSMKEYDPKKTDIDESRNYFKNDMLFHQTNNKDCESPFASDYIIDEDKRIKEEYQRVLDLVTKQKNKK